jgi:hypothetical protein
VENGLTDDHNKQALRAKQLLYTSNRQGRLLNRSKKKKTKSGWVEELTGNKTNESGHELVGKLIEDDVFTYEGSDRSKNDLYTLDQARLRKWIRQTEWYQEFSPMYRDLLDKEFRAVKIPGAELLRELIR